MEATKIWEEYKEGLNYQDKMHFREDFPKIIEFKEGRQWPTATKKTKNFPRPVFNFTEMFIKSKRAATTNQPLSMDFVPIEIDETDEKAKSLAETGAKNFSNYSKILWENIDQDELNNDLVDDALTVGTGVLHYYWDDSITGGNLLSYLGEVNGEIIDALNIVFANPRIRKIQKQPWIIVSSRMTVKQAREIAEKNKIEKLKIDEIRPDNDDSTYFNDAKLKDDEEVTVLTKYYKENGEVFYTKSTRNVFLMKEKPLTPIIQETEEKVEDIEKENFKISLYPIVVLSAKKRKNCIYGRGEAEDYITINKLYNQLKGMIALNAIRTGNPNLLTKPGALRQQLTNEGGQNITDFYQGQGDGIKYMQPPTFSTIFSQLSAEIFDMARTVSGVTDVSTGEVTGANMAASAIIALQNQAKTPIKEFQQRYFSAIKEVGDIWCQFFKTFYSSTRAISVEDSSGNLNTIQFRGTDYANIDFKMKIDVGVSSEKESLVMNVLENLKASKDITKEQYLKLAPDTVIPFKNDLSQMWEKEANIKQQLAQALEIIKRYQETIKKLGGNTNEMQQMQNGNASGYSYMQGQ